jgi:molecular chaperone GrpE
MSSESNGKEGLDAENAVGPEDETGGIKAQLDEARAKNEQLLTRIKYLQADFENYRKRTEKEVKETEDNALSSLVKSLLETLDELELAVRNAKESEQIQLYDGLKMVQKKLISSLGAAGLSRVDCVGRPFDPAVHEAVEKVDGSGDEDVVIGEVRPGYVFRGRVLRPSMVKVELAQKRPGAQGATTNE